MTNQTWIYKNRGLSARTVKIKAKTAEEASELGWSKLSEALMKRRSKGELVEIISKLALDYGSSVKAENGDVYFPHRKTWIRSKLKNRGN